MQKGHSRFRSTAESPENKLVLEVSLVAEDKKERERKKFIYRAKNGGDWGRNWRGEVCMSSTVGRCWDSRSCRDSSTLEEDHSCVSGGGDSAAKSFARPLTTSFLLTSLFFCRIGRRPSDTTPPPPPPQPRSHLSSLPILFFFPLRGFCPFCFFSFLFPLLFCFLWVLGRPVDWGSSGGLGTSYLSCFQFWFSFLLRWKQAAASAEAVPPGNDQPLNRFQTIMNRVFFFFFLNTIIFKISYFKKCVQIYDILNQQSLT